MDNYDQHLAQLIKEERGARAERQGFLDGKEFPSWTKPITFSKDEYEQRRYNNGWENARAIIQMAQVTKEADDAV